MEPNVRRYHGATPVFPPVKAQENCISSDGRNTQVPAPNDESKGESTS